VRKGKAVQASDQDYFSKRATQEAAAAERAASGAAKLVHQHMAELYSAKLDEAESPPAKAAAGAR
jgi:hypothetical protein